MTATCDPLGGDSRVGCTSHQRLTDPRSVMPTIENSDGLPIWTAPEVQLISVVNIELIQKLSAS